MAITPEQVRQALNKIALPDGGTLISRDLIRALTV